MRIYTAEEIGELSERRAVAFAYYMLGCMSAGLIKNPWDFGYAMVALGKRFGFAPLEKNLEALCIERGWGRE